MARGKVNVEKKVKPAAKSNSRANSVTKKSVEKKMNVVNEKPVDAKKEKIASQKEEIKNLKSQIKVLESKLAKIKKALE